jgi:hypothetical protein
MAQVIAKCSLTGHYLFMGIDCDAERFAFLPETIARKFCPYCCCEHAWYKKDATLAPRRQRSEPDIRQAS